MLLQRYTQRAVASGGIGINTLLARADPSRKYLGFFIPSGGNTYVISTNTIVSGTNPGISMPTATAIPCLEFFTDRHGVICQQEWQGQSNAGAGTVFAYVLELFEWEQQVSRSDGGVILGPVNAWRQDALEQIQSDTATMLLQSIRNAIPRSRNGRHENSR